MPPPIPESPSRAVSLALASAVIFPRATASVELRDVEQLEAVDCAAEDALLVLLPFSERELALLSAVHSDAHPRPTVGTLCRLLERTRLPDGSFKLLLQGLARVEVDLATRGASPRRETSWTPLPVQDEAHALRERTASVLELVRRVVENDPRYSGEMARVLALNASDAASFVDHASAQLALSIDDQRALLEESELARRVELLGQLLERELARAGLARGVEAKVQERLRRGYLREQLEVIRGELGLIDPVELEATQLEAKIAQVPLPEVARRRALRELAHFRGAAPGSAEAGRIRNWLEWMTELPWGVTSPDPPGLAENFARLAAVLERTHTSLADVKTRVTEFLAVRHLSGAARGTVLCFNGPPGTGKTSMGRAVAEALGREFVHIPVGGVADEVELRGRHHTQPGAVAGRILQGLSRAGRSNPVVLIDEIDKIHFGGTGDTGGALLEILDPEQNREFLDHYLGVPFDLSECIFLVTTNDTEEMPDALLDRLEVIPFGSYTESDKLAIAREHLIPRARAAAGLGARQFKLSPGALLDIVRNYTEEAGVRHLQRTLNALARKAAVHVLNGDGGLLVRRANLLELLGPANVDEELHLRRPRIGVTMGLAWTSAGGSMLPIEALIMPGAGRTMLTGSVGDVMRESVQTAISWVRTCFRDLALPADALETVDIHLHFPSSATPKDGPSAGIAIATSLVSLLTRTPVRHDIAMSGEMSLLGAVLPVGGLREKLLAAVRAGVRTVVVPARNSEEVLRLPPEVRQRLEIVTVDDVQEALAVALMPSKRSRVRIAFAAQFEGRQVARRASGPRKGSSRSARRQPRPKRRSG